MSQKTESTMSLSEQAANLLNTVYKHFEDDRENGKKFMEQARNRLASERPSHALASFDRYYTYAARWHVADHVLSRLDDKRTLPRVSEEVSYEALQRASVEVKSTSTCNELMEQALTAAYADAAQWLRNFV